ncbi:Sulfate Permease (SulP) Family [Phytophthora cinnamomi]|uniref:Sulfate Permease (SulP) Family n=1 Tax=Phytophthora cinnamomi TaxID=4785 RepID=UPI00355A2A3C|nr:Sulfate Permease (SulP) Family [Phytophthora cinnamomi]
MSFADFASGAAPPSASLGSSAALSLPSAHARQAVEGATLKLEQFQRQVLAVKRASTAAGAVDEDLHDRVRFACLLQEEIAKALARVPADAANSLIKRKLCKDFEAISTQLEAAVLRVSAREQAQQQALKEQQDGRIVAEHQGQVFEFAELENEIAHNEALIEEREQDINKIHQSVAQVNEIFRDLAAIVQDQQGAIDDIETHVHESMQQTQQGLDEVKKASDMQSYCAIQ